MFEISSSHSLIYKTPACRLVIFEKKIFVVIRFLLQIYGYNFYGAPWQPEYGSSAYSLTRGQECLEKWNQIPTGSIYFLLK
jgi:hypothetical protein